MKNADISFHDAEASQMVLLKLLKPEPFFSRMFGTTSPAFAFTFSCMTLRIGIPSFGDDNWEQASPESLVDFIGVVLRLS